MKNISQATPQFQTYYIHEVQLLPETLLPYFNNKEFIHTTNHVDNFPIQQDVEAVREWAKCSGRLIVHVVHQQRPRQSLETQQLICDILDLLDNIQLPSLFWKPPVFYPVFIF